MNRIKGEIYKYFIKKDIENDTEEIRLSRLLLGITIIWIISSIIFFFTYSSNGEFGDMFGSVNTLFSGLAFGGIIYTIYQQRAEFRLQREELQLQREEVAKTNQELEAQVRSINIQRFENTFFHMVSLHNEITKSLHIDANTTGRNVFIKYYRSLVSGREGARNNLLIFNDDNIALEVEMKIMKAACNRFFNNYEQYLGHYFRNLFNLFRLIEKNQFIDSIDEKKEYSRIIRSQLSAYELILLFYNCFQDKGSKFKYYAEKYRIFDNLTEEMLMKEVHQLLYNQLETVS